MIYLCIYLNGHFDSAQAVQIVCKISENMLDDRKRIFDNRSFWINLNAEKLKNSGRFKLFLLDEILTMSFTLTWYPFYIVFLLYIMIIVYLYFLYFMINHYLLWLFICFHFYGRGILNISKKVILFEICEIFCENILRLLITIFLTTPYRTYKINKYIIIDIIVL